MLRDASSRRVPSRRYELGARKNCRPEIRLAFQRFSVSGVLYRAAALRAVSFSPRDLPRGRRPRGAPSIYIRNRIHARVPFTEDVARQNRGAEQYPPAMHMPRDSECILHRRAVHALDSGNEPKALFAAGIDGCGRI